MSSWADDPNETRAQEAARALEEYNRLTPLSELRHWSTYATVSEWYRAYDRYVPSAMAAALGQRMTRDGLTFREAYAAMHDRGGSIAVHDGDEPTCGICALLHTPAPEDLDKSG